MVIFNNIRKNISHFTFQCEINVAFKIVWSLDSFKTINDIAPILAYVPNAFDTLVHQVHFQSNFSQENKRS